ncbi:MAG: hypothetical protein Q8Q09_11680 [Deltaproteobacteria bacterium]|nr:hypothetical protein [Deltaproteobacteria bacterium]
MTRTDVSTLHVCDERVVPIEHAKDYSLRGCAGAKIRRVTARVEATTTVATVWVCSLDHSPHRPFLLETLAIDDDAPTLCGAEGATRAQMAVTFGAGVVVSPSEPGTEWLEPAIVRAKMLIDGHVRDRLALASSATMDRWTQQLVGIAAWGQQRIDEAPLDQRAARSTEAIAAITQTARTHTAGASLRAIAVARRTIERSTAEFLLQKGRHQRSLQVRNDLASLGLLLPLCDGCRRVSTRWGICERCSQSRCETCVVPCRRCKTSRCCREASRSSCPSCSTTQPRRRV